MGMEEGFRFVYQGGSGEIEEKKSRFIATVQPVTSEEEALQFIQSMKKKYWDARHNCYAYVLGEHMELCRASDDGEPAQTAGRPMLDVLLNEGIHDCVVVVTRYFGGVLLGTGGLVRAYQKAVQEGLAASVILTKQRGRTYSFFCDYTLLGKVQYLLAKEEIAVQDTIYTDRVEFQTVVPESKEKLLVTAITEETAAKAECLPGEKVLFAEHEKNIIIFQKMVLTNS